jgi:hypothetical protein
MTHKADPIHKAADTVAEVTGIPRLVRDANANHKPRRQIILPTIAVLGSIIAFVATLYGVRIFGAIAPFFFITAMVAQQFGPIRLRNSNLPYDEWERLLIWRSRSIGLGTALAIAILGCAAIALYDSLHDAPWRLPANSALAAMWLLTTTATALTTISASLILPKGLDDEDEG